MSAPRWTDAEVIEFRNKRRSGMSIKEIAQEAGVSYTMVARAILGYSYINVPDPVPPHTSKARRDLKRSLPYMKELTDEEWELFCELKRKFNLKRNELLKLVKRPDLAEKYPSPGNHKGPRK